jgi:hypothetical protein
MCRVIMTGISLDYRKLLYQLIFLSVIQLFHFYNWWNFIHVNINLITRFSFGILWFLTEAVSLEHSFLPVWIIINPGHKFHLSKAYSYTQKERLFAFLCSRSLFIHKSPIKSTSKLKFNIIFSKWFLNKKQSNI